MERKEIENLLMEILEEIGCEIQITDGDLNSLRVVEDLGLDSLDVIDLLSSVEDEFEVEISDDEAQKMETVGNLTDLLEKKLHGKTCKSCKDYCRYSQS